MKKFLLAVLLCLGLFLLVGCSNATQKYADKVQAEIDAGNPYTVEEVREDLGDECLEALAYGVGYIIAVEGCESKDAISAKLDAGEEVYGVVITFADGKSVSAKYQKIDYTTLLLLK